MIRRISYFLLTVFILTQAFCINISASSVFSENCIKITRLKQATGNIYGEDKPAFSVKIVNPEATAYDAELEYVIYNDEGNAVWTSETETVNMKPSSRYVKNFKPDFDGYGLFTIEAKISGEFGEFSEADSYTVIAENKTRSMDISAQMHIGTPGVETNIDGSVEETTNAGFGWIRDDARWFSTETGTTDTKYVIYDAMKNEVEKFTNAGSNVLLSLGLDNSLYGEGYPQTSTGIQAYADFCAYVAKYFKGKNVAFEMGNEPDNANFAGEDYSGSDYAKALLAGASAVEAVNPEATIVGGALCPMRSETQVFMDELLGTAGVVDAIDVFSFHPYNFDYTMYSDEDTEGTFLQQVEIVKEALKKHGAEDMPIWITEYGNPSIPSQGLSERFQAANLVRTIAAAKSEERIENFSVFNFRKKDSTNAYLQGLGIVDEDYNAKPAYVAISFMNKLLGTAEYANERYFDEDLSYNGRDFGGVRFLETSGGFNEDIFVLWEHTGKTAEVTFDSTGETTALSSENGSVMINIPSDYTVKCYDMFGNLKETDISETVSLTEEPIYIVCTPQEQIKMTMTDGTISFYGKTEKPNTDVTAYVMDETTLEKEIVAIGQTKSDSKGYFNFSVNMPQGDDKNYSVYAYNGTIGQIMQETAADYKTEISWFVNGVLTNSVDFLSKVTDGDAVKLKINITDNKAQGEKIMLYGAVIGKENLLLYSDISSTEWVNGEAELEVDTVITKSADVEQMKFFLWNENMNPIYNSIVVK